MKEMWNERFSEAGFAYGDAPNVFFKSQMQALGLSGKVLFPAEGEGRNAVYAASQGLEAVAFDISDAGKAKADQLAKDHAVSIRYQVGEFPNMPLADEKFDAIVLVYAHFPPPLRPGFHRKFVEMLKPGGYLIMEAFSKTHLPYREKNPAVGGPWKLELLLSPEEVSADFTGLETLMLEDVEVELAEGKYHNGVGKVVRYVGQK
jgi:SAM-dependent methyltransferase